MIVATAALMLGLASLVDMAGVAQVAQVAQVAGVAGAAEPDRPVPVRNRTTDGEALVGRLIEHDAAGFTLRDRAGETRQVEWGKLNPRIVYSLHVKALGRDAEAERWLKLGELLLTHDGERSEAWADRALKRAERMDRSLADRVKELREGGGSGSMEKDGEEGDGPPDRLKWPELSEDEQAEAVKELKEHANETQKKLDVDLRFYETRYFLFCTDVRPRRADRWQGLLDNMYDRLLNTFGLPGDENVWKGKALVFVFEDRETFHEYERKMENHEPPEWAAGLCHQSGGVVRIAFYELGDDRDFAHIFVHESAHGFIYRYRSRKHVPSWLNEGLAEWIAFGLVPQPGRSSSQQTRIRSILNEKGGIGQMFTRPQIGPDQYPLAYTLTNFMISQNKSGYVDFIQAIKDGVEWREALRSEYGTTLPKLVNAYADRMKLRNLELDPKDLGGDASDSEE